MLKSKYFSNFEPTYFIILNYSFRIASGVIDGIIQKCFNSKPKTKEVATEICLQVRPRVELYSLSAQNSQNHNKCSKSFFSFVNTKEGKMLPQP